MICYRRIPENQRSSAFAVLVMMVIALAGPGIGLLLATLGVVLAPPWTFLTGMIYTPLACLGLSFWLAAAFMKWLKGWWLLAALALAGIAAVLFLAVVGPWLPTGMTACRPLDAPPLRARYACVSTSSDDSSYRYEFVLEGWANWPVMRLVKQKH